MEQKLQTCRIEIRVKLKRATQTLDRIHLVAYSANCHLMPQRFRGTYKYCV